MITLVLHLVLLKGQCRVGVKSSGQASCRFCQVGTRAFAQQIFLLWKERRVLFSVPSYFDTHEMEGAK